ncbi:hypothetical protein MTER_34950 [Mycolicibacter terrae]|uniref:Uncharacterized protein n=1 Tax=Mycolicibacter terrae TaxID=1788 RepID=A0AAD1HZ70_9MYCO|nr:hypothetical protein MTER_34950 [Mycolicibacter terrae]SNV56611.1 Uncharacterised protein [Mycolicibacter terrae]
MARTTIRFANVGTSASKYYDLRYWYCTDIVTDEAAKKIGDRAERFKYEYEWLSDLDGAWTKRRVRELAAMFRNGQPQDIALLPDIGEPL